MKLPHRFAAFFLSTAAWHLLAMSPSTAVAAPGPDLAIDHVEVTQGLQNKNNSIPLVAGRPTVVRVFPRVLNGAAPLAGVSARLSARRGNVQLPGSPIAPNIDVIDAPIAAADRGDPKASLDFTLEPGWETGGETELVAELIPPSGFTDPDPANNKVTVTAKFVPRRGLSIRYIQVKFTDQNWPGLRESRSRVTEQTACDFLRSLYPADPNQITYDPFTPARMEFGRVNDNGKLDGDALIHELNVLLGANQTPDRLFAWTPDSSYPDNGLSDPRWAGGKGRVAFGNDTGAPGNNSVSRWRRTFAHEIGHNTDADGLQHTDQRLASDEFGYDVLNVDPFHRVVMRRYPAGDPEGSLELFDVMRGGELEPHAWITPTHYTKLFDFLNPSVADNGNPPVPVPAAGAADAPADAEAANMKDLMVIGGTVSRDGKGRFYPIYLVPATPQGLKLMAQTPRKGTHELRFYAGEAELLAQRIAWTPAFAGEKARDAKDEEFKSRPFTFFVRPVNNLTRIDLLIEGKVVATRKRDDNKAKPNIANPVQSIVANAADSDAPKDRFVKLKWESAGAAADGGADYSHQVYFSNDAGKTWQLVATGLTKPEATINVGTLLGGEKCQFQVRTTNGFDVTIKDLPEFKLATSPPKVTVVAPRTDTKVQEGGAALLLGHGFDYAGKKLPGDRLEWVEGDQKLGKGEKIVARNLKPGKHIITLRDSENPDIAQDKITIEVREKGQR
jgi:hypothetical protein